MYGKYRYVSEGKNKLYLKYFLRWLYTEMEGFMADNRTSGQEEKQYTVGGYTFTDKKAADAAKEEFQAINKMSSKINTKDARQVYALYNSIIDKKLFSTMVGLNYLKELQQFLYICKEIPNNRIRPIPINNDVQSVLEGKREIIENQSEIRILKRERNMYKSRFTTSIIINLALVVVIIAMIIITLTSKNPNIINYETKLQDKYSAWQEQLQSEEASLKAREAQIQGK